MSALDNLAPSSLPTRYRVYNLLSTGQHTIASAARLIKIASQVVDRHAKKLLATGALQRIGSTRPFYFTKGPQAGAFVALTESHLFQRPGSSRLATLAERVHGDLYKFAVLGGPASEPAWRFVSRAKGVEQYSFTVHVNGLDFTFRDYRGPKNRTIMVEPAQEFNTDPAKAAAVRERRRAMAELVGVSFANQHGFRFAAMEVRREPECAARADIEPFGNPNVDLVYADRSPAAQGTSELEWRAQAARAGAVFLNLPVAQEEDRLWKEQALAAAELDRARIADVKIVVSRLAENNVARSDLERQLVDLLRPRDAAASPTTPRPLDFDPAVM